MLKDAHADQPTQCAAEDAQRQQGLLRYAIAAHLRQSFVITY